jgi:hypothetical protein
VSERESPPLDPPLDPRRAAEFRRELVERAGVWIRDWNSASGNGFGTALLEVAARFGAQVAERLSRADEKLSLGLLDWLAVRAKAALPARMPVAFKLADTAAEVLASKPVRLQADVDGATVVFETEADVRLVPGTLDLLVGVNAAADEYYLPPPGLSSLDPLEPLPTQWRIKSYADATATHLQLDPALGLEPEMLLEIGGQQFRVIEVEGDLVTIDPPLDVAGGIEPGTVVDKVSDFDPFGGAARNRQEHVVYLGDENLFNLEAPTVIELHGTRGKLSNATFEYFGKAADDDQSIWRELERDTDGAAGADTMTLSKPRGAIDPTGVSAIKSSRWIRARQTKVDDADDILLTDQLSVVLNPGAANVECPASGAETDTGALAEGFANTTPLAFTGAFYPLGQEPKQFDTFYLGCADAFSKKSAAVSICFEFSNMAAHSLATLREGVFANRVLASVGGDGALHLLELDTVSGVLTKFRKHEPLQPKSSGGNAIALDPKPAYRLPMWAVNEDQSVPDRLQVAGLLNSLIGGLLGALVGIGANLFANPFFVATTAGNTVWIRKEYPVSTAFSRWIALPALPPVGNAKTIDGLVYLRDAGNAATSMLYASFGGKLFRHSAVEAQANTAWEEVELTGAPAPNADGPFLLSRISPVTSFDGEDRWHGTLTDGLVALFSNGVDTFVYSVDKDGNCDVIEDTEAVSPATQPAATHIGTFLTWFWVRSSPVGLRAKRFDLTGVIADVDQEEPLQAPDSIVGESLEIPPTTSNATVLATARKAADSWIISWKPFQTADAPYFESPLPSGVGPLGGAPTVVDKFIVASGIQSEVFLARWDPLLRTDFTADLKSGIVVPASLTPAIAFDDVVAFAEDTAAVARAKVGALTVPHGNERLHALQTPFSVGATNKQLVLFRRSGTALAGTRVSDDEISLTADPLTQQSDWLLIEDSNGDLHVCQVATPPSNATPPVVTLTPDPTLPAGAVNYWRAERLQGRIAPYMQLGSPDNEWNADVLKHTPLTIDNRNPRTQRAEAFEVVGPDNHPTVIVLERAWNAAPGDGATTVTIDAAIGEWTRQLSERTSTPELLWEYFNGTGWQRLVLDIDETQDFQRTGKLRFSVPPMLQPTDVQGKANHWIRARLIRGDYGRERITVLTKPDPNDAKATITEVVRDASDFHPPLVVNMRVRYSVTAGVPPTYVLTLDSGSYRDQSDANRTGGAQVEGLVPLSVLMKRLSEGTQRAQDPAPSATAGGCACCDPTSEAVDAAARTTLAATPDQAVLLGLNAVLKDEPINVLLLVEERMHDAFAPLTVEVLTKDRFERIAVRDTTRALGESGLLSMAFPVKAGPRDLFGKSLTWLRLSPGKAATGEWQPKIRGAYLNAAWATATETLTREALGSSDGRPALTVQVARPPLLHNTLELRVREPLDDEERAALKDGAPGKVKSNEPDLPGDWVLWTQVPDPTDGGPRERVYALDESSGEIVFGDGIHGMIPPIGRDSIVAFSYQRTEPPAPGSEDLPANLVTARTALQLVTPVEGVEAAFAADRAAGGSPPQSNARVLRFGTARLRHRDRAITPQDFADLALESSPDIAQAQAFRTRVGLRVIVVMRGEQTKPDAAQRRALTRLLQQAASPLLGERTAIAVDGPRVRRMRLHILLRVDTLEDAGRLGVAARGALKKFFDPAMGGPSGGGWPLGAEPVDADIAYALDDAPGLAGIGAITLGEIDDTGRESAWRGAVRNDEIVLLAEDGVRIEFESLEVQS